MATYIMRCGQCGHTFEVRHRMDFDGPVSCPICDSDETSKVPTAPGIVFDWKRPSRDEGVVVGPQRYRPPAVPQSAISL